QGGPRHGLRGLPQGLAFPHPARQRLFARQPGAPGRGFFAQFMLVLLRMRRESTTCPLRSKRKVLTPPRPKGTSLLFTYTQSPSGVAKVAPPSGKACQALAAEGHGFCPATATTRAVKPGGKHRPSASGAPSGPRLAKSKPPG